MGTTDQIRFSDFLGDAKEVGGAFIGKGSYSISHTDAYRPTWITVGISEGASVGSYGGVSQTFAGPFTKF